MRLWFRVEHLFDSRPTPVLVRQLQQQDFRLGETATLGGCRISPAVSQPRALKPDGSPDGDLFVFHLADGEQRHTLTVGARVELIP